MRRALFAVLSALVIVMSGCATVAPTTTVVPSPVDVVSLTGVIDDRTVDYVTSEVDRINADAAIKAVVIAVNSGGGGVTASFEVYEELAKLTKPAVVWCDGVCASGAMLLSMSPGVKAIYGRAGVICGSIGVIMHVVRDEAPPTLETYRSGNLKQANSHPGAPTEEEKAYLQKQIDEMAAEFYGFINAARGDKVSKDAWVEIKTARIFFDHRCVDVGLLDEIVPRETVIAKARALAN